MATMITLQQNIAEPQLFKAPVRQAPVWCAGPLPLRGARAGEALFAAPMFQSTISFGEPVARATRRRACRGSNWHFVMLLTKVTKTTDDLRELLEVAKGLAWCLWLLAPHFAQDLVDLLKQRVPKPRRRFEATFHEALIPPLPPVLLDVAAQFGLVGSVHDIVHGELLNILLEPRRHSLEKNAALCPVTLECLECLAALGVLNPCWVPQAHQGSAARIGKTLQKIVDRNI